MPGTVFSLTPLEPQFRFWGQNSQISSSLSPKRDCGSKGVKEGSTPNQSGGFWLYFVDKVRRRERGGLFLAGCVL